MQSDKAAVDWCTVNDLLCSAHFLLEQQHNLVDLPSRPSAHSQSGNTRVGLPKKEQKQWKNSKISHDSVSGTHAADGRFELFVGNVRILVTKKSPL